MENKAGIQDNFSEHEGLRVPLFRDVLVKVTFDRRRAIGNQASSINLGVFRDEINAVGKKLKKIPKDGNMAN